MPKILINEKDNTSAGTPGAYSNNSVLICGFSTKTNEEIITAVEADPTIGYVLPDENGVFEFYSQNDFKNTIGKVAPVFETTDATDPVDDHIPPHYGNQMAYELLGQGYQVIYYSLGKVPSKAEDIVKALKKISGTDGDPTSTPKVPNTDIWGIFKDKASYDFRFITHGLLSAHDTHESAKAKTTMDEAIAVRVEKETAYTTAKAANDTLKATEGYVETTDEAKAAQAAEDKAKKDYEDAKKKEDTATIAYAYAADDCFTNADFNMANAAIVNLAKWLKQTEDYEAALGTGRGDCVALVEINEAKYVNDGLDRPEAKILAAAEEIKSTVASEYCACTVPSVVYKMTADTEYGSNKKFPGAFHYLACYKRMIDANFAEWYAAAGYTRGVSNYTIDYTTVKLGEVAIQTLEPRYTRTTPPTYSMPFAVNVIANFRGSYYLWGNRTCAALDSFEGGRDLTAKHFLNIRHLCSTIKKQLYVSCRRFTFDPNSDTLWINFKNSITPTLDRMKADQGVRDYKIEKVYTDKKATLRAKIRIVPIEAVEDFVLELSLEDSLGETGVTITE